MVVMNEDTDFESIEPLSVEKRVEMFFFPGNVATPADNQCHDQNDENDEILGMDLEMLAIVLITV